MRSSQEFQVEGAQMAQAEKSDWKVIQVEKLKY